MKRKILFSLMTIALVGALVGAGVFAYFSDVEMSEDNTFTAGTLDLKVNTENPWTSTAITAGPMEPGAAASTVDLTVENSGTIAGDLYMRITSVTDTGGTETYACGAPINGDVTSEPECVAEIAQGYRVDDISTVIILTCTGTGVTATHIDGQTLAVAAGDGYGSPTAVKVADLAASGTVTITFGGEIPSSVTNEYQGDVSTFTVEFYLAQDGQTPS